MCLLVGNKNYAHAICRGVIAYLRFAKAKRGVYQPRNRKIHSSRRIVFLWGKRHHANLRCVESIYPFFALIREVTQTHFRGTLIIADNVK